MCLTGPLGGGLVYLTEDKKDITTVITVQKTELGRYHCHNIEEKTIEQSFPFKNFRRL